MAREQRSAQVRFMARKWCGFLAQNQDIKEEWELLESCAAQAERMRKRSDEPLKEPPTAATPEQAKAGAR